MISRAVSIPNLARDRKLCIVLAHSILRDQHAVRSLDQSINDLKVELEAMESQKQRLQEKITILKSAIKVFNKPFEKPAQSPHG